VGFAFALCGHRRNCSAKSWAALGPQDNEKRRLTLEDATRRFRRSAAVFGDY